MNYNTKTIFLTLALVLTLTFSSYATYCYLNQNSQDADAKKFKRTAQIQNPNNQIPPVSSLIQSKSSQISSTSVNLSSNSSITIQNNINSSAKVETKSSVMNLNKPKIAVSPAPFINCNNNSKINLTNTKNPFLIQLNKYQDVCNSKVASKMMVFVQMPSTIESIEPQVDEIYYTLKEFSKYGITPVVIAEPVDGSTSISFTDFANGNYNQILKTYFTSLKNKGITDQQMGVWVPFPEANIPAWNSVGSKPEDFSTLINNYASELKNIFPTTPVSVLLNSGSYDPSDKGFTNQLSIGFDRYISGIKPGLISSFGMQGFPWAAPKSTSQARDYNPFNYLKPNETIAAANKLGVNEIWFNTGTFTTKYNGDSRRVVASPAERKTMNNQSVDIFKQIKNNGFKVWVNEFVEDKTNTLEATNFSYLNSPEDKQVFSDLVNQLGNSGIEISLYDSNK